MASHITLGRERQDLNKIFDLVDREGEVVVIKKQHRYHIHRLEPHDLSEDEAVKIGEKAMQEYKNGKTRPLADFVNSEFPEYGRILADQKN